MSKAPTVNTMIKPTLVVIGSQKGGVGKTTTARLLTHWLENQKRQYFCFDTESPNGSLSRFYPDVSEIVDVNETEGQMKIFDPLLSRNENFTYMIDLRAGIMFDFLDTMENLFIMKDVREGAFRMYFLHVLGASLESLQEVKQTMSRFEGARHVVVRNLGAGGEFSGWTDSDIRSDFLAKGGIELTIPPLDPVAYRSVDQSSSSYNQYVANERQDGATADNSYILRAYVRHWLVQCDLQMDKLKI
jgi:hypothetical protein